ncbi:MAG: DNA polymerase III subunit gamma/tau C-terminal domain-containing protein, partial [Rhodocyclaceae bacterium]|nr:DNA polymerase III subunit gamma/tau C-terminal domain-containing protein [Rhodocyclaceae bacterium]
VDCEATALRHLAKAAAGSMRDARSLLDHAIAHVAGRIEEAGVRAMLGTVGDDHLFDLLGGLAAGDIHAMLALAATMEERSLSFDSAFQELATKFHRIALVQFAPTAILDAAERERLAPYAERLDAEFLQLCYQIAIHGRDELALAPDEAAGFGMVLLRLHAFRPDSAKVGAKVGAGPSQADARPSVGGSEPGLRAWGGKVGAGRTAPPAVIAPAPTRVQPAPTDDWHALVAQLPLTGMARQLAQHCELASLSETQITLRLSPVHKHLSPQHEKLQAELQKHHGRPLALKIELTETAGETPKARADNEKRERQDQAIAAIEGDPFVREVCDLFDASIDESTIKPI